MTSLIPIPIRIGGPLFEELVRRGTPVSDTEHLTTLYGMLATYQYDTIDEYGNVWRLVMLDPKLTSVWLPAECCLPMNPNNELK